MDNKELSAAKHIQNILLLTVYQTMGEMNEKTPYYPSPHPKY